MEKRVSTQLMSTELVVVPPARVIPKMNYWRTLRRVMLVVGGIAALIVVPALVSGKLHLPTALPAFTPPHAPDLAALGAASLVIKLHLATVAGAAAIGIVLMARIKGTPFHRQLGWIYSSAMFVTGLVTLAIPAPTVGPHLGPFGPLHLFSVFTLLGVPRALLAARRGEWELHGRIMASLFIGGIGIAGIGAFLPGRLMNQVFFG
jgi:uncharacterized membrane protein